MPVLLILIQIYIDILKCNILVQLGSIAVLLLYITLHLNTSRVIMQSMEKVFIYWDNSNIFINAQRVAEKLESDAPDSRYRVRIHFENLFKLAARGRKVEKAHAVGSVPPELRAVWNQMEGTGIHVTLLERGEKSGREQGVDAALQVRMFEDLVDYNGDPGIGILLTGDGAGFYDGVGFHSTIERMHRRKWRIEVLSWRESCNVRMKQWAEENGVFIALDNYYNSITFLEPPAPGRPVAPPRSPVDLTF